MFWKFQRANMKFEMDREDGKNKWLLHQTGGEFYTHDAPSQ